MKDKFNNAVGPQVRVDKPKAGQLIPVLAIVLCSPVCSQPPSFLPMSLVTPANSVPTTNISMHPGVFCYGPINGGDCFN